LNLRCLDQPGLDPECRDSEQLLSASITLDDAKPLFLEYQAAGVLFPQPLKTEPWGARTFIVRDLDGNLILFAGRGEAGRSRACSRAAQKNGRVSGDPRPAKAFWHAI
jgi:Glyoxalase/Bleomycin resistance protein/Dioxygenase superfamily